jgi:putative heme degradation protein
LLLRGVGRRGEDAAAAIAVGEASLVVDAVGAGALETAGLSNAVLAIGNLGDFAAGAAVGSQAKAAAEVMSVTGQ